MTLAGPAIAQGYDEPNTGSSSNFMNPVGQPPDMTAPPLPGGMTPNRAFPLNLGVEGPQAESEEVTRDERRRRPQRKPLPPNAFQRFVQATSGRLLPLYGTNYFDDAPSTFAQVRNAPVPADYVIGPGDEIIARVTGVLDLNMRLLVDRTGRVTLPKVGSVSVAGVRVVELEPFLIRELSKSFRNFSLSASLGALRSIDVYLVGQARQPGKYTVSSLTSLVNALFVTGGPNGNGSLRHVHLIRAGKVQTELDLYKFMRSGDKSGDVNLLPGDTIVFPPAVGRVALLGDVYEEAIYELSSPDESIGDVLGLAGGLPITASHLRTTLERIDPAAEVSRSVEHFSLDAEGMAKPLRDGDIITLFPISPQFQNAVTLRGNVAHPLRYPYKKGMRIKDLIPDRDALINEDYYRRKNLLVQFEDGKQERPRRKPAPQSEEASVEEKARAATLAGVPNVQGHQGRDDTTEQPATESGNTEGPAMKKERVDLDRARREVRDMLDEVNWEYAVVERLNKATLTTELIPFHLGKVVDGDESQNLLLQPGDVVTVFGERDLAVPQARKTRLVRVEGEVGAPGVYQLQAGETLQQLVARVGGFTDQAYIYGLSLKRESVRRAQEQTLDVVVRQLEGQMRDALAVRQANLAGSADAAQIAALQAQLQSEERLARERLEKLRMVKPEGRVSLELDPTEPQLPPVILENDDEIYVPAVPSFVSVHGAVHNENSLLWKKGRSVSQYLDIAGPSSSADLDNLFVLRADGSVVSKGDGWFGNPARGLVLEPGDVIIVPEMFDRETGYTVFMRGLKDWTQILGSLALAAVAVKVLASP